MRIICLVMFLTFSLSAQDLTIEQVFSPNTLPLKTLNMVLWDVKGDKFYFQKRNPETGIQSFYSHDIETGEETLWLDPAKLIPSGKDKAIEIDDYSFTKSGKGLLIKTDSKRIWRRYSEAAFYLYSLSDGKLQVIHEDKKRVRHAKMTPDESHAAYAYENNIYLVNLDHNTTKQITYDGNDDIINGQFDWVYEEEFGQDDGWRWSPDGKKIAFWRLDQTQVPQFSWMEYDSLYGKVRTIHYPKAGEKNSLVQIGIYHLDNGKTIWADIGDDEDIYIPRINWTNDPDILMVQRLNRLQNQLDLMMVDVSTGKSKIVLTETDPCWIDIEDNLFFIKNNQFIWTSERDGYRHIYLYDLNGKLVRQLTKGEWEVSQVYGVNEKSGQVFFTANKGAVSESHLFSVELTGRNLRQLSEDEGTHSADFSPDFNFYMHNFSSFTIPDQKVLCKSNGKKIRSLVENNPDQIVHLNIASPELVTFKTSDGIDINAMITRPVDFDPHKKYPVLIYGYSGPASQLVRNRWGRTSSKLWNTLLTQKGYIIFTLDQRGTGGRGKAFKNLAYGDIGKYMIRDHVEGVKYLRSLPYVDGNRIGIWGWSGGGYLTLLAMSKTAQYFKAGIAVAPVSDYRLYDSIWTERYMGLPQANSAGYDSSSALNYVCRLTGKVLLIHGASDDNVHLQNSMQFIDQLILNNQQFEMMIYPERNHSLFGKGYVYEHLYTLMTDFLLKNL
ncbi:MAG: S9 family peptidase [Calditrichaceae bacterium]|nr:S9 family peptidase [Calditrichaceae bacterium]MBN2709628.1 S9 family peptidase [Calditrichaceae bacterium]RQV92424.1 MAG: S9 family peptidase [Calditrichota bacterium]